MEKGVPIRSLSRGVAVLQAINRGGSLTMMEVARTSDVPYPTAARIVQTLLYEGLIEIEPARKRYRPAALVQTLAHGFQEHGLLTGIARPHLIELTAHYGWPLSLLTPVGHAMVLRDSTHQLSALTYHNYYPGHAFPMLDSASGLAYLAHLPDDRRTDMLAALKLLPRRDNIHTIGLFETTDFAADIRRAGVATANYNQFTRNPGKTSSIAAPVTGPDGVVGAITVAFFSVAMKMGVAVDKLAEPLREAAGAIGQALSSRPHANMYGASTVARGADSVAR